MAALTPGPILFPSRHGSPVNTGFILLHSSVVAVLAAMLGVVFYFSTLQ